MKSILVNGIAKLLLSLSLSPLTNITNTIESQFNNYNYEIAHKFNYEDESKVKLTSSSSVCKGDYILDGYSCIHLDLSEVSDNGHSPLFNNYTDTSFISILENKDRVFAYIYQDSNIKFNKISISNSIEDDLVESDGDLGFGFYEKFNDYDLRLISITNDSKFYKYEIKDLKPNLGELRRYLVREVYSNNDDYILDVSKEYLINKDSDIVNTRDVNKIIVDKNKIVGFWPSYNADTRESLANHFIAFNTEYNDSEYGDLVNVEVIGNEDHYYGVRDIILNTTGGSSNGLYPIGISVGCFNPFNKVNKSNYNFVIENINPFDNGKDAGICQPINHFTDLSDLNYSSNVNDKTTTIKTHKIKSIKKRFSIDKKHIEYSAYKFFGFDLFKYKYDTIQKVSELKEDQIGSDYNLVKNYKYLVTFNSTNASPRLIKYPGVLSDIKSNDGTYIYNQNYDADVAIYDDVKPWIEYNQVSIISLSYLNDFGTSKYLTIDGYDDSMGSVEVYSPVYTGPKINLPGWLLAVIILICLLVVFGILVIIFPPVWVVIKVVFKVLYYIVKYLLISLVWIPYLILVLPIQAIVCKCKDEKLVIWNPFRKKTNSKKED